MGNGIIVLFLYFLICIISSLFINADYKRYRSNGRSKVKIKISSMIIIATLFSVLNWFITVYISNGVLGSDRLNYNVEFQGVRSVGSPGLQWIFDIVLRLGGDIYWVFYLTTFITCYLTLVAYRRSQMATPKFMVLLFVSEYIFFTFTGLKQAYAVAFSYLFFVNAIENKTLKGNVLCIIDISKFSLYSLPRLLSSLR